jgi:hypothetical protein
MEILYDPHHLGVPSGAPKQFLRLWSIWRKSCTYLALKLTLSPNWPKRASIWAPSPRSTIRCIQNNFWAYGSYGANHAPIMHQNQHYLQKDRKEILHDQRHLGVPSGASKMISKAMLRLVQNVDLSYTEATLSPNRPKQDSIWPTWPCSSIGCVQNDFWAYGTFGANRAPVMNQD